MQTKNLHPHINGGKNNKLPITDLTVAEATGGFGIWASTRDFQLCSILTSVDSDEPVQPPFQLKHSK